MAAWAWSDGFSGVGRNPFGLAPVPEPGPIGVVVGVPHGRSKLSLQVLDGPSIGLPGRPCGCDDRLKRLKLFYGLGPAVLSLVEAVDEGLAPIVERRRHGLTQSDTRTSGCGRSGGPSTMAR
jgi:hypothetical protein